MVDSIDLLSLAGLLAFFVAVFTYMLTCQKLSIQYDELRSMLRELRTKYDSLKEDYEELYGLYQALDKYADTIHERIVHTINFKDND